MRHDPFGFSCIHHNVARNLLGVAGNEKQEFRESNEYDFTLGMAIKVGLIGFQVASFY